MSVADSRAFPEFPVTALGGFAAALRIAIAPPRATTGAVADVAPTGSWRRSQRRLTLCRPGHIPLDVANCALQVLRVSPYSRETAAPQLESFSYECYS